MEKISFEDKRSVGSVAIASANKINEIIDLFDIVFESLRRKEDRLKTLEDKFNFVMKNALYNKDIDVKENSSLKELYESDLYDEQNEKHLEKELIKEFIEPTVKECDCKECNYNNLQKKELNEYNDSKNPSVNQIEQITYENIHNILNGLPYIVRVEKCDSSELGWSFGNIDDELAKAIVKIINQKWTNNNQDKIEEIISDFKELGEKYSWDWTYYGVLFESWLRDKLKDICK